MFWKNTLPLSSRGIWKWQQYFVALNLWHLPIGLGHMLQDFSILEAFSQDAIVRQIGNRLDSVWHPAQAMYFYFFWDFQTGFVTHPVSSQGEWESKAHLKVPSFERSEGLPLCLCSLMVQTGITFFFFFGWVACNFDLTCFIRLHICALILTHPNIRPQLQCTQSMLHFSTEWQLGMLFSVLCVLRSE